MGLQLCQLGLMHEGRLELGSSSIGDILQVYLLQVGKVALHLSLSYQFARFK